MTVEVPAEREVTRVLDVPAAAPPREVRFDPDAVLLATFREPNG